MQNKILSQCLQASIVVAGFVTAFFVLMMSLHAVQYCLQQAAYCVGAVKDWLPLQ
ncbi:MAG: hypothetical protein IPP93_18420 [Chitinophagaceae bacterium]|nr:hypothetical protein [Chitinophagaceae bacterium]MBL0333903.1 hypothetical protein [Chitinophagaceae bacterium]